MGLNRGYSTWQVLHLIALVMIVVTISMLFGVDYVLSLIHI